MSRTAVFAREQLRAPFTLALLIAIPALFVVSAAGVLSHFAGALGGSLSGDASVALSAGWAAAFISGALGFFQAASSRNADRRLALAGLGAPRVAASRIVRRPVPPRSAAAPRSSRRAARRRSLAPRAIAKSSRALPLALVPADDPAVAVRIELDAHHTTLVGQPFVAPPPLASCHENLPRPADRECPRREKAPQMRGFSTCAEEDSNLHPVIPDQALNLVTRVSYPSKSVHIVQNVTESGRIGRNGRAGCCRAHVATATAAIREAEAERRCPAPRDESRRPEPFELTAHRRGQLVLDRRGCLRRPRGRWRDGASTSAPPLGRVRRPCSSRGAPFAPARGPRARPCAAPPPPPRSPARPRRRAAA